MRSGAFRQTLTIQRRVQVGVISLNTPNMVWQDWIEPFCEVSVLRGREHFDVSTKQRYSEDVYHFRTRWDDVEGVTASMRVSFEESTFNIKSIRPDAQHRGDVIIECTVQDFVLGAAALSIAIEVAIPSGTTGVSYGGFTVSAAGGTEPYTFLEESGSLPPGLTLNASTGAVTGTPTQAGTYSVDLQVTDDAGTIAVLPSFNLVVA